MGRPAQDTCHPSFPLPPTRPRIVTGAAAERSLELYGEKPGGLELCGIFTVYSQEAYDSLSEAQLCEVRRSVCDGM